MEPSPSEILATIFFACAVVHTFSASLFEGIARRFQKQSIPYNLFHFMGEVEVVFGLWAALFLVGYTFMDGFAIYDSTHQLIGGALHYLENRNFTEPAFIFVIMAMSGTRPVILMAEKCIRIVAKIIPLPERAGFYITTLTLGPLLGSLITEPAAMTVTALILLNYYYTHQMSPLFKYATIGLLFVNISMGGTLTHFAAPPILIVAAKWNLDIPYMIGHFGYKAAVSCTLSTLLTAWFFRNELKGKLNTVEAADSQPGPGIWITLVHLIFIALVVYSAHYPVFFLGLFIFFLGFVGITQSYQEPIKLKESLLVGFFLAGLVTLGGKQAWWLQPILTSLDDATLFYGTIGLTGFTDNAALTYLGGLVEGLSDSAKFNLLAGAVSGGGLTVIANAPNPAGFGILKNSFGGDGINPLKLFLSALIPTVLAMLSLQLLPSIYI